MDDQVERRLWLRLVHSQNASHRIFSEHLRRRWPEKSLIDLKRSDVSKFLTSMAKDLPAPGGNAIQADLRWLQDAPNRHLLPLTNSQYPRLLREIPDPPIALFVNGNPRNFDLPCISIVGSRNPTPQGRELAFSFARSFADMGFAVVSGLANGIDGYAHRGALATGISLGVCAHGLDMVYPRGHRSLAAVMAGTGALISEFPTGTPPRKQHFPWRNRLISGISVGTLVVEAGLKSGSLITARLAAEQNREVFAMPGSIQSPQSKGCHYLIKNGAALVESLEDILQEIGQFNNFQKCFEFPGVDNKKNEHSWFLKHMGYAPCTRDELLKRSGLTSPEVSSMLLALELEGCVEMCPGGTYVRVNRS